MDNIIDALSCRSMALTDISTNLFKSSVQCNLQQYPHCLQFWWPLIERRVALHNSTASELLLNPVFRWAFLGNRNKLDLFEIQLDQLCFALGTAQFRRFCDRFIEDTSRHPIENDAHNRMLSAYVEIQAILHFASQGYSIELADDNKANKAGKKPDFCAKKNATLTVVEAKYIRPPDKLLEFLLRWWQAQDEIAVDMPLGPLPYIKFEWEEWEPVVSRNELSQSEISGLKEFFTRVFLESNHFRSFTGDRLKIKYEPDRKLPISPITIPDQIAHSKKNREGIFPKIEMILENACVQLKSAFGGTYAHFIYLAINKSPDIVFLWQDDFSIRLNRLIEDEQRKGVEVIYKEVGYL